jgi:predicted LPLAT superfamily acyltransferase
MYEENARKVQSVLNAINPKLVMDVIGLGKPDAMIAVVERLERGDVVGILPDRSIAGERQVRYSFLGAPAAFPHAPFRMAALLKRPVVLMFGLYRGGRRYDIHFEPLIDPSRPGPRRSGEDAETAMRLYVERLEHYCRMAPFNWFNFYDFWA